MNNPISTSPSNASGAIAGAQFAFEIMDSFGVFDSLKSPSETELRLAQISQQLEEIDQSINEGVFDILEQGLKLQITAARNDSKAAWNVVADQIAENTDLTATEKATALAQAVNGLNAMANAVDGVLAVAGDFSPELFDVMFSALTHSMTVMATAAKLWSNGDFTGSGYNHGGLMGHKVVFEAGIEAVQKIEDRLTETVIAEITGYEINFLDFPNPGYLTFDVAHGFQSDLLARRFFDSVIPQYVRSEGPADITYEDGFITVRMPGEISFNPDAEFAAQLEYFALVGAFYQTIGDAYYNFVTGLEPANVPGPNPFSYDWYGDGTDTLVDLIDAAEGLVDGTRAAVTGFGSGQSLNGTSEADYLTSGVGGDTLYGGAGDDYLLGNGGDDRLFGGIGDDVYAPGAGNDWIEDSGSPGDGDTVVLEGSYFDWGFYLIDGQLNAIRGPMDNPDEQDVLIGIESVKFDDEDGPIETIAATGDDGEIVGLTITIVGSSGDDVYVVDDEISPILELFDGGRDTVQSHLPDFTLGDNIEVLLLGGPDAVTGRGNDLDNVINGNSLDNTIYGLRGDDTISGGAGADTILGGAGADTMLGGAGNDIIVGGPGSDVVLFYDAFGNYDITYDGETFTFTDLNPASSGDDGTDTVKNVETFFIGSTFYSKAELIAEVGDPTNTVPGLAAIASGGQVNEDATVGTVVAILSSVDVDGDIVTFAITDTAGNAIPETEFEVFGNEIRVSANAVLDYEAQSEFGIYVVASDEVSSSAPQQILLAVDDVAETIQLPNGGAAFVDTGVAELQVLGGTGDDTFTGNSGANTMHAKAGNDSVVGGASGDLISGGQGNDDILGLNGADALFGGAGADDIRGGNGADDIAGGRGADNLVGGSGSDEITGGNGADKVQGGNGEDLIFGGGGNDDLFGGARDDMIDGGFGKDSLTGNNGADSFVFDDGDTQNSVSKRDVITDFERGTDVIDLRLMDADLNTIGDQGFDFTDKSVAGNSIWLRLTGDDLIVMGDNTGDGVVDFRITLLDIVDLSSDDFLL